MPGVVHGCSALPVCLTLAYSRWWVAIACVVLLLAGCATTAPDPAHRQKPGVAVDDVLDPYAEAPRIQLAYQDRARLAIVYSSESGTGRTVEKVQANTAIPAAGRVGILPVSPLAPLTDTRWVELQKEAMPLDVRGPAAWLALLGSTLDALAPVEPGRGAVVDFLHRDELFLYRDDSGMLESVPMVFQPAGVEVVRSYTFNELLTAMRGQLLEQQLPDAALLFETGDAGAYGYPFVYVSSDREQIVFLQHPGRDGSVWPDLPFGSTLGVLARTVIDHIRIMLNQPVSSVARLFTLVASSTTDLVNPKPLALLGDQPAPPLQMVPGMDLQAWETSLDALTGTTASSGRLRYHVDGSGFFPRFMDLVNAARESVYLRVYIFDNDDYALQVADLLARKSAAVDVKVLVDGLGTFGAGQVKSPTVPPGHETPLSIVRYLEHESAIRVRTVPNPWLAGDHTKSIIVDGRVAFVGGMNIGREYRYDWHDLMVEVDGPVVEHISADFEQAWISAGIFGDLQRLFHRRAGETMAVRPDDYPVRLLYTRPGDSQILRAQIAAIRTARQRIFLQNPYLTSDAILYELVKARRRGVDVRVILPYRSDNGLITRSNVLVANAMLRNGIRVYIYPGMSHLKAAAYDGWICLGSANFDNLSLRVNREMNLATAHAPAVDALLEQVFRPDFETAVELTGPLPNNWLDYLSELLADSI